MSSLEHRTIARTASPRGPSLVRSSSDVPPGNRLHPLEGDRAGQHAIWVNDQWRICFRWHDGSAYDVEIADDHD
ncbi:MAG: type II toxin-antitoxin system RelE/ParE family toxin [Gemmatimonadaceae bacterium]|nr:type II toxin-antitoxin system RelE/ParE family toxin [Gemmatimonadaceae bacterium]